MALRYDNMKFPAYKYQEFPKKITVAGKRYTVQSKGEEMDIKLRFADAVPVGGSAEETEQMRLIQPHIDEKKALFQRNLEIEAEMVELKKKIIELSSPRPTIPPLEAFPQSPSKPSSPPPAAAKPPVSPAPATV